MTMQRTLKLYKLPDETKTKVSRDIVCDVDIVVVIVAHFEFKFEDFIH